MVFISKIYAKDESFDPFYTQINKRFLAKSRVYPAMLVSLGLFVFLTQVLIPLVTFKTQDEITGPVSSTVLGVASGFSTFSFNELEKLTGTSLTTQGNIPQYFKLSIPRLKIEDALVESNSPSLNPDQSLGHYKNSGLPGEVGNAFIYGHSVLPWFYNPKNYKTIFSTLDTLSIGDTIYINFNNKEYKYKVEGKKVLLPEEVDPLAEYKPRYLNDSTVTLMTCVPPGTKMKRLLVYAVMFE